MTEHNDPQRFAAEQDGADDRPTLAQCQQDDAGTRPQRSAWNHDDVEDHRPLWGVTYDVDGTTHRCLIRRTTEVAVRAVFGPDAQVVRVPS